MRIFAFCKADQKNRDRKSVRATLFSNRKPSRIAGNVFFALFAAVAMVGTVGYGFNTVLRGPISTMTEVTRRTVAESTVVTSSRLVIVGATTQQTNADCDNDGMIEPMPFRDAAGGPAPAGGGYLPADLVPNSIDPWKTEYGYCAWDSGPATLQAACGTPANRLAGAPDKKHYVIAVISAGKDKKFQTGCAAHNLGDPTAKLITTVQGSDDIVLGYTYAEANDLGSGMWKPAPADPENVAETRSALEGSGSATFGDAIVLQGNLLTGGGLVLPGDPGDSSLTGPCNLANDKQIRRNLLPKPPVLEICDFASGLGWAPLSGVSAKEESMTGMLVARWKLDETSGILVRDSATSHNGTLHNVASWSTDAVDGGSLAFTAANDAYVRVPRSKALEASAITVSMWIKRAGTLTGQSGLLAKTWQDNTGPTYHSYNLSFSNNSSTEILWTIGHSSGATSISYDGIPNGQWTHITASYNPLETSGQMKIYINGALASNGDLTEPVVYDPTDTGDLYIGTNQQAGGQNFNGSMDEVRVYNYGLSAEEVHLIYNASKTTGVLNQTTARKGRILTWGENNDAELGASLAPGVHTTHFPRAVTNGHDFIQSGMGCASACGLKAGGTVWCWGSDTAGQLGNGTALTGHQSEPTQVEGLNDVVQISAGCTHKCALKRDGSAWCWGAGTVGQLGNGGASNALSPVQVSDINDFTFIAAGLTSSCGIRQSGEGWCWGSGSSGQLGNGDTAQSNSPVKISNIDNWATINLSRHTNNHACGLARDGGAYCWGSELTGNFGNGSTSGVQTTPSPVQNSAGDDVWTDWISLETTWNLTCGVRAGGTGWCWGSDSHGQIGNGDVSTGELLLPAQVSLHNDFSKIAVGSRAACGVRVNGDVSCWGEDATGQLGNGPDITDPRTEPHPTPLKNVFDLSILEGNGMAIIDTNVRPVIREPADIGKISVDAYNTACAIDRDNSVWCWGNGALGILGNGGVSSKNLPSRVNDAASFMRLSSSGASVESKCGIKADGTLWCWGSDSYGVLGNGAPGGYRSSPDKVITTGDDTPWASVSMGNETACGIKTDSTLWCWGNIGGTSRNAPERFGHGYTWKQVAVGRRAFCAITTDGIALCQGAGTDGVLANGVAAAGPFPLTPIKENGPWVQISMSSITGCGIKADGTLWCWGDNTYGQSGIGVTTSNITRPRIVAGGGPWAHVSTGWETTCGIKTDGSLWCWGRNNHGQLGIGTTSLYPAPVGGGPWTSVSVKGNNACGIKEDKSVWCWGSDVDGAIGNGAHVTSNQNRPHRVSNFPHPDAWSASEDGGGVNLRKGVGAEIGTQRYISGSGAADTGLRLEGGGRSSLRTPAGMQQLIIESAADAFAAQLSLKAAGVTGFTPPKDIIGWWKFDDAAGTIAIDSIGNNHGALVNGPAWAAGAINSGLTFNAASTQSVLITNAHAFETGTVTVSTWARRSGAHPDTRANIVSKIKFGNPIYGILLGNGIGDNKVYWHTNDFVDYDDLASSADLENNTWVHIVGVYDPSGPAPQKRLYINGSLDSSTTITTPLAISPVPDNEIYIGALVSTDAFNGMIDDVQIYRRALTDVEIAAIYRAGVVGTTTNRVVGTDPVSGSFKISRDGTGLDRWLGDIDADMEVIPSGNVGIGTGGSPQAKLDVRGAIKIGNDGGGCGASNAGTIKWDGVNWHYCSATSGWTPFGTTVISINEWDKAPQSLATGYNHSCAIKVDGSAWCWGDGEHGKLGNGSTADQPRPAQVKTDSGDSGWKDWVQISGGRSHSCGLRADGSAWCWGHGQYGILGNDDTSSHSFPVRVVTSNGDPGWNDWIQISSGNSHTCGIRGDGSAWCWGSPGAALGFNSTGDRSRPARVKTDADDTGWNDWVMISSGNNFTCGLRAGGSTWCWGTSTNGVLGGGASGQQLLPHRVLNDVDSDSWSDWISITSSNFHSCGIRINRSAWCWGSNDGGRIGSGASSDRPRFVEDTTGPGGWNDWIMIEAGAARSCGIRADGSAWCWGYGATGDGTGSNRSRPVRVKADDGGTGWNDWISIKTGQQHTCGMRTDSSIWCWGIDINGKLGDNDEIANKNLPVRVDSGS